MSTATAPTGDKLGLPTSPQRRIRWGHHTQTLVLYIATILLVGPIWWMIVTSFKTEIDAYSMPPRIIFSPTLENYQAALSSFWTPFWHSVVVVGGSTLASFALGIPAAFALVYYAHRNNQNVLFWFITTKALPAVAVLIPLFVIFKYLHLLDTPWALIILYTGMNTPLVVWMMHAFINEIPRDIMEAAQVDGMPTWRLLWNVVLPLTRSGMAATAMLCIVFAWNEFLFAVSYTATRWMPLPVAVAAQQSSHGLFWAKLSAFTTLAIIVPIVIGWVAQKQLVRGLTTGGIK